MKNYGKALKILRKKSGMTQAQLAEKLNVSYQAVSKWENGVNTPDISLIEEMCALFSVTVEEFLKAAEVGEAEQPAEAVAEAEFSPLPAAEPACAAVGNGGGISARNPNNKLWIIIVVCVLGFLISATAIIVPTVLLVGNRNLSADKIYAKVNPSVFCITVETEHAKLGGSGFFIDNRGTAVTNYHVIEGIISAEVKLSDGRIFDVDRVVGHDVTRDIAIIHVNVQKSVPAELADSNNIRQGDKVYAIGYPQQFVLGSQDSTLTDGIISKTSYTVEGMSYIQSTVDITHGNSGGVLVNTKGKVIGVTTAGVGLDNITYMNMSVPINAVKSVDRGINLPIKEYAEKYSVKITVTYMIDGKVYASREIFKSDKAPQLSPEVSDDYEFLGWYEDEELSIPFDFSVAPEKDAAIYAKCRFKNCTFLFDGGEDAAGKTESVTVRAGESAVLPANGFAREGFKFIGWECDGVNYSVGDSLGTDGSRGKITVSARWAGVKYTLKYVYGGDELTEEVTYGERHKLKGNLFEREGYKQNGWTFGGENYPAGGFVGDFSAQENAVVILQPYWEPIKYKIVLSFQNYVTFDGEDYSIGSTVEIVGTYGKNPFDEHGISVYGLELEGWEVNFSDGEIFDGDLCYITSVEGTTVYASAKWVSSTYHLELYHGEHDEGFFAARLTGREEFVLPSVDGLFPKYDDEGYHFVYWKQKSQTESGGRIFRAGETVSDLMVGGEYYYGTYFSVRLYACWERNAYTFKFDGDGAEGSMPDAAYVYRSEYDEEKNVLPANAFVKEGYVFAGWRAGEERFEDRAEIKTVYEHGTEITLTVCWLKEYRGEGTAENPYKIGDYEDLKSFSEFVRGVGGAAAAYYELTADIDCGGKELKAAGYGGVPFAGVFDGCGKIIENALFAATKEGDGFGYKGLFASVNSGQIKNLGIKNYVIDGKDGCNYFAPIACEYYSAKPLENCFAEGSISWEDGNGYFSGFVAVLMGKIYNSYSVCEINMTYTHSVVTDNGMHAGNVYIGGFICDVNTADGVTQYGAENCYADARINISVAPDTKKVYRHYSGLFIAAGRLDFRNGVYKNCFATGGINYNCVSNFNSTGNHSEINVYVHLFNGDYSQYSTDLYDNVYVASDAAISYTDKTETDELEVINRTDNANLRSLAWLQENLAFDGGVWQSGADGGLPTLKLFSAA